MGLRSVSTGPCCVLEAITLDGGAVDACSGRNRSRRRRRFEPPTWSARSGVGTLPVHSSQSRAFVPGGLRRAGHHDGLEPAQDIERA
jgi:hypothetical protein